MNVDFGAINFWAVIVSTAVCFGIGALWYTVFAKAWMSLTGITRREMRNHRAEASRGYLLTAVAWLIAVLTLASLLQLTGATGIVAGLWLGLTVGIGLVAATQAPHFTFEFQPILLFLIDEGYLIVGLAVAGMILALWR